MCVWHICLFIRIVLVAVWRGWVEGREGLKSESDRLVPLCTWGICMEIPLRSHWELEDIIWRFQIMSALNFYPSDMEVIWFAVTQKTTKNNKEITIGSFVTPILIVQKLRVLCFCHLLSSFRMFFCCFFSLPAVNTVRKTTAIPAQTEPSPESCKGFCCWLSPSLIHCWAFLNHLLTSLGFFIHHYDLLSVCLRDIVLMPIVEDWFIECKIKCVEDMDR